MKKTLLRSALVICAITAITADAACYRGGCSKRRTVARFAVAKNCGRTTRQVRQNNNVRPQPQAVRRGGCANGSCSL